MPCRAGSSNLKKSNDFEVRKFFCQYQISFFEIVQKFDINLISNLISIKIKFSFNLNHLRGQVIELKNKHTLNI